MALHGKFVTNDAYYSPLSFPGVGTFLAFSGNGAYRNRGACEMIPKAGPVPTGKYWIVDRPKGGLKSQLNAGGETFITTSPAALLSNILNGLRYGVMIGGATITHGLKASSAVTFVYIQGYSQKVVSLSHMMPILPCCVMHY